MAKLFSGPAHNFVRSGPQLDLTPISSAALLTLAATPVLLTKRPPAGTLIVLRYAVFRYAPGDTGFTVAGDRDLMIEYTDGTDASLVCLCDNNTGGIDFTGTTAKQVLVPSAFPANTMATLDITDQVGVALQLDQVGSAEWAAGNGSLSIAVVYDTIKLW
jgi:hypothetical protein